jgi:acetyl esterase/lipase
MMIRRLTAVPFLSHSFGLVLLAGVWVVGASALGAEQQGSEDNERLARFLEKYPEADADKDGVLTRSEAMAYRRESAAKPQKERAGRSGRWQALPPPVEVRYGPHERNVLDFYRADADEPTPVLIYFHGGGFVSGDKRAKGRRMRRICLENGISAVGANYRFVSHGSDGKPGVSFPAPMLDGARVVQFVRSKADEWNIDPERVACSGGSAGALMSTWLATHDDLADPESEDPIARQSTRISCAATYDGPTELDRNVILKHIGGQPSIHPSYLPFFGAQSMDEMDSPEKQKLVWEASPTNHVTKDDPPLFLRHNKALAGTPHPPRTHHGRTIHHPMHGMFLKGKYDALGLTCHVVCEDRPSQIDELAFLKKHLVGD